MPQACLPPPSRSIFRRRTPNTPSPTILASLPHLTIALTPPPHRATVPFLTAPPSHRAIAPPPPLPPVCLTFSLRHRRIAPCATNRCPTVPHLTSPVPLTSPRHRTTAQPRNRDNHLTALSPHRTISSCPRQRRSSCQIRQVGPHSRDHAVPIFAPFLPIQSDRGIPRTVGSVQQPAPAGVEAIQNPHGLAQRRRQVCRRRIDGNHQIQILYERRGIGEIMQQSGMVDEAGAVPMSRFCVGRVRTPPVLPSADCRTQCRDARARQVSSAGYSCAC